MALECHLQTEKQWFRLRACGLIVHDNAVLMVGNERDPYYYSVGGGVNVGESTYDAAIREVHEETGVVFPVERLAIIHENYFFGQHDDALQGLEAHELAFYYLMRYSGEEMEFTTHGTPEGEQLYWVPLADFPTTNAYPAFLPRVLPTLGDRTLHIRTIEGQGEEITQL